MKLETIVCGSSVALGRRRISDPTPDFGYLTRELIAHTFQNEHTSQYRCHGVK